MKKRVLGRESPPDRHHHHHQRVRVDLGRVSEYDEVAVVGYVRVHQRVALLAGTVGHDVGLHGMHDSPGGEIVIIVVVVVFVVEAVGVSEVDHAELRTLESAVSAPADLDNVMNLTGS